MTRHTNADRDASVALVRLGSRKYNARCLRRRSRCLSLSSPLKHSVAYTMSSSPQKEVVRPLDDEKAKTASQPTHDAEKQTGSSHDGDGSVQLSPEVQKELERVDAGGLDAGYERKVFLLNKVMQEHIGMGKVSPIV